MANTLSQGMANLLATPVSKSDPRYDGAPIRVATCMLDIAATESLGHIFVLKRFNATDRIIMAMGTWENLGTTRTMDLGLYEAGDWTRGDQASKDPDIWRDAQAMNQGAGQNIWDVDMLGTGSQATLAAQHGRYVWEDAGETTQPPAGTKYDCCWTLVGSDAPVAGVLTTQLFYVTGS